jgi:hypothetical protein
VLQLRSAALAAAIAATIEEQVAALKHNMAAEYAAQEREVLDRIAQLEAIETARKYGTDRAPSLKMLLEYVALNI